MRTIVVVEDDEPLAYATGKHLTRAGYEVIVTNGTMSSLQILDTDRHVDLFLIDIGMPEGQPNGLALARMANIKRHGIRTAFMTGYHDLGNEAREMGIVFFKPLEMELLTTTFRRVFGEMDPLPRR